MVTCRGVIERLGSLVDGDTAWDSVADRHLDRCTCCARYLQSYRTTVVLAQEASREPEEGNPAGGMPESLVRHILWSRRARSLASASWQVAHLIGVAASPLIVFSLAR